MPLNHGEQLNLYAVRTQKVSELIGLGLKDPEKALRHWHWAQHYTVWEWSRKWELPAISLASLLWCGSERASFDGEPDSYWHGLQGLVASVARDIFLPENMSVAADFDEAMAQFEIAEALWPTRISHRFEIAIPDPIYVDARIITHDKVLELAHMCQTMMAPNSSPLSDWLKNFSNPTLQECDLWMFSPGMDTLLHRPGLEDPPAPIQHEFPKSPWDSW